MENDDQDYAKVSGDHDFQNDFIKRRPADSYWLNMTSIQLTPLNKIGFGRFFKFTFSPVCLEKGGVVTLPSKNKRAFYRDLSARFLGSVHYDHK